MSRMQRIALVAAAVVGAVIAFIVLRPDGDDAGTGASQATETETQPATTVGTEESTPTETATEAPPTPPPAAQRIVVRGGAPVGGPATIEVRKGEAARFVVLSDVAEEVHVHGYDRSKPVAPGTPARFDFPATIEGVFEIELENAGVEIARLVVRP